MKAINSNRTRVVSAVALAGLLLAFENLPAQRNDSAPGGRPRDRIDLCAAAGRGERPLAYGCTALELALQPAFVTGPILTRIERASARLEEQRILPRPVSALREATRAVQAAHRELLNGEVCGAAQSAGRAAADLDAADQAMQETVDADTRRLLRKRAPVAGDVQREEMEIAVLHLQQTRLGEATRQSRDELAVIEEMCAETSGPFDAAGRVIATEDVSRTFLLENGTLVGLPAGLTGHPVMAGVDVAVRGTRFIDGSALATTVAVDPPALMPIAQRCMEVLIAPIQPYPPAILHELAGYAIGIGNEILLLEQGMRFAARNLGCAEFSNDGNRYIYSMKLELKQESEVWILASDLHEGSTAVPFWSTMDPGKSARLFATVYRRECVIPPSPAAPALVLLAEPPPGPSPGPCFSTTELSTDEKFVVAPLPGLYSHAFYASTAFGVVDNGIAGDFEVTSITGRSLDSSVPSNAVFGAEGYKVTNGISSRPGVVPVVQGNQIAIYEDDFFDPDLVWTVGQVIATGTVTPSGLRWPHVDGTRNGKPFRYFTQLPSLRRDRVAACSISPAYTISKGPGPYPPVWGSYTVAAVGDTFYKLPFDYGFQPATGLLNIDDPFVNARHPEWQAYAFDLVAPYLALLRAARGGEVVDVVESDPYNVADAPEGWPGIGNYVWIQHEDGTIGIYFHIAHQQALVAVGQKLRRGDPVALCGETGNASEPHVHFEVINPDQSKRRIRFQAIVNSTIDNCFLPRSFHVFQSTNTAP